MDPINGILLLIITIRIIASSKEFATQQNLGGKILFNILDIFKSGITPVQSCSLFTSGDMQLTAHSRA